jgi:hypothetical protein
METERIVTHADPFAQNKSSAASWKRSRRLQAYNKFHQATVTAARTCLATAAATSSHHWIHHAQCVARCTSCIQRRLRVAAVPRPNGPVCSDGGEGVHADVSATATAAYGRLKVEHPHCECSTCAHMRASQPLPRNPLLLIHSCPNG